MRSNKCLVQAAQPICQSAVCILFIHPRMLLDVFAARGTLLVLLVVYQDSQGLFCRATPQPVSPQLILPPRTLPSQLQDFVFILVKFRQGSCLPIPPAYHGLSEWQGCLEAYWLVLSVSWHLQTWEECTPWLVIGKAEWDMSQDRLLYYFTCYQTPCRVWPDQIFTHLVAQKSKL